MTVTTVASRQCQMTFVISFIFFQKKNSGILLCKIMALHNVVNSYVSSQEAKEAEEEDKSVDLISLKADDVTAVSFKADDADVEFDRKDDSWTEKSDADFPVNQDTVDDAVKGVASLTADQEISDVEDLSQYELDDPQNTITLTTAETSLTVFFFIMLFSFSAIP